MRLSKYTSMTYDSDDDEVSSILFHSTLQVTTMAVVNKQQRRSCEGPTGPDPRNDYS